MQILDAETNLRDYLLQLRAKNIKIISAFAGGTENLLTKMIAGGNSVELVVGTINAFTSPDFISFCAELKNTSLVAHVDFRGHLSTHWKLYLINPDITIIGSANFTDLGVSLQRDTCIVISSNSLYREYIKKFRSLKDHPAVLRANSSPGFKTAFATYRLAHERTQAGLTRARQSPTLEAWLGDESNQAIALFIWTAPHPEKDKIQAQQLLDQDSPALRDYFTYQVPKSKLPYSEGDVVLCCGARGGQMDFYVFDKIIYKGGKHFIYSYRRRGLIPPFNLAPIKAKIKDHVARELQDLPTSLSRTALATLAKA